MTANQAYGYSSESTQRELSNKYQHDVQGLDGFQKICILVLESSLSIGRVKTQHNYTHDLIMSVLASRVSGPRKIPILGEKTPYLLIRIF